MLASLVLNMVTWVLFFELSSCFGCFHMVVYTCSHYLFVFQWKEEESTGGTVSRVLDSTAAAFKANNNNSILQILQGIIK